ncbi:MAG: hypothetical protein HQM06_12225 [Magnetococcales bacterium]|nr:hypothetical protein [Magnetococcales bacterium]
MNESHPMGFHPDHSATHYGSSRSDPLAELESRWEKLARSLHESRTENRALHEELSVHESHLQQVERELADRMDEIAALHEEKQRFEARINNLLNRYDEIG